MHSRSLRVSRSDRRGPHESCQVAGCKASRRQASRDDTAGPDHGAFADGDSLQDRRPRADLHPIGDVHRCGIDEVPADVSFALYAEVVPAL